MKQKHGRRGIARKTIVVSESAPPHNKAYRYRKTYRYQRGSKLWKNCIHQKNFLKMAGGRMHNPHPTPRIHLWP